MVNTFCRAGTGTPLTVAAGGKAKSGKQTAMVAKVAKTENEKFLAAKRRKRHKSGIRNF